jgi:hypothetical protein
MADNWQLNGPPVHISVAAYMGMMNPSKTKPKSNKPVASGGSQQSELEKLAYSLSNTGGILNG